MADSKLNRDDELLLKDYELITEFYTIYALLQAYIEVTEDEPTQKKIFLRQTEILQHIIDKNKRKKKE